MHAAKHGRRRDKRVALRHRMGGAGGRYLRRWSAAVSDEPGVDLEESVG